MSPTAEPIPGTEGTFGQAGSTHQVAICGWCGEHIWRAPWAGDEWEHLDTDETECPPDRREAFQARWSTSDSDSSSESPEPETPVLGPRLDAAPWSAWGEP